MSSPQRKSTRIVLRPSVVKPDPDTDYLPSYTAPTRGSSSSSRSSPSTTTVGSAGTTTATTGPTTPGPAATNTSVQTRVTSKKSSRDPASRKAEYNRLYYAKNRGVLLKKAAERARTIRNPQTTTKKATIKLPASLNAPIPSHPGAAHSVPSDDGSAQYGQDESVDVEMPFWEEAQLLEALVPPTPENSEIRQLLIDAYKESMSVVMDNHDMELWAGNYHPLPASFYEKR